MTTQYAIFMIATLTMLIAVPSAFAATLQVDSNCGDTDSDGTCNDGTTYKTIQAALRNTTTVDGDIISIADGEYTSDNAWLTVWKSVTITSTNGDHKLDDVLFKNAYFNLRANNTTIKGITFEDSPSHGVHFTSDVTGIVIEKNHFSHISKMGINISPDGDRVSSVKILDNLFENIGYNSTDTAELSLYKSDKTIKPDNYSAMYVFNLVDSVISGNTIDKTTSNGMTLRHVADLIVTNNTIKNVPYGAINLLMSENSYHLVQDNTITNATYLDTWYLDTKYANGTTYAEKILEGKAIVKDGIIDENPAFSTAMSIRATDTSSVAILDNVISNSKHGLTFCPGDCDPETLLPKDLQHLQTLLFQCGDADSCSLPDLQAKIDKMQRDWGRPSSAIISGNAFDNVSGFEIINSIPDYVLSAPLNYYGSEKSPLITNQTENTIFGNVVFGPWYADAALTQVAEQSGSQQTSLTAYNTCSVALEKSKLDLPNSEYGKTSGIATQKVTNAGSVALSTIEVRVTDWTDETNTAVPNIHSEIKQQGTNSWNIVKPGSSLDITENLPVPRDGNSKMSLDYRVDMTGNSNGPSGSIKQTVTYIADCS